MRVVIAGGSGLIGKALTAELVAAGHEAILLSRTPHRLAGLPAGTRAVGWDGTTVQGWGDLVAGSAIVNLAGESIASGRWNDRRKRRLRDSRLNPTRAVVAAVAQAEPAPTVLVQGSAVGFYGPGDDRQLSEESPPGGDFLAELCVHWEEASAAVEEVGVRRAVIRTGVVLSAEGGALPRILLPFRLFAGGAAGHGRQWFPWIHLADEVAAIRFLIEHGEAAGIFNLTAPNPLTNREFAKVAGKVLRRPSFIPAPAFALRLMLGEMADLVLEGQRAVPQRLQKLGFPFRFLTAEAALRDLLA